MKYSYAFTGLLTIAFSAPALADDCSKACGEAHDTCAAQPGANLSTCASEYASCLGYNPYDPSFVEPTACSKTTATSVATTTPTSTGTADACAADCITKHEQCQTKPGANMAVCANDFAECLGYNPYEPSYVAPTACAKTTTVSTPIMTPTPTGKADACAKACISQHEACQNKPQANMAVCAADFASCLGYNPYDPSYVEPTACSETFSTLTTTDEHTYVTAAAGHMQPVLGLLALGAAALL